MIFENLSLAQLVEESIRRNEGKLARHGALVTRTGRFTGRAAKDKYFVRDEVSEAHVDWGKVNQAISPEHYQKLRAVVMAELDKGDVFVQRRSVGADKRYALPLVVTTPNAWHALFAHHMFREPLKEGEGHPDLREFHVYHAPEARANPRTDGTRSDTFIVINFGAREVLIGGTAYAGEIKKSIFTIMNYLLPQMGVMTMHCGANIGEDGRTALFFGLSGTGKTTLSTDETRKLLGDDEHGWSEQGVFNLEGGCYAKAIRLSPQAEPEIYRCVHTFGTIVENVPLDEHTRMLDLDSSEITENTRAAYPLESLDNVELSGVADHPIAVVMLACDAFGVLPPVARLTPEQAMYYFLSGYTAKVAGTEAGLGDEPVSTFSPCFGEPFMALSPIRYADLLGRRLKETGAACYLVNTGWWKGAYGVGERMPIRMSRTIVRAAVSGELASAPAEIDPNFGFAVPTALSGIESRHLKMEETWADKAAYTETARRLASMFVENFKRYEGAVDEAVLRAGPRL